MQLHPSVQIAWAIANTEANLSGERLIQPVHFLLGLLKVIDARFIDQIQGVELPDEDKESIRQSGNSARHFLEMTNEEAMKMRRSLRKLVRTSAAPHSKMLMLHRSDQSRALFQMAAEMTHNSGGSVVTLVELANALNEMGIFENYGQKSVTTRVSSKGADWGVVDDRHSGAATSLAAWPGRRLVEAEGLKTMPPFVGREKELQTVLQHLSRTQKRNIAIIGPSGCGKTALIRVVAKIIDGLDSPDSLRGYEVVEIHGADISADCDSEAAVVKRMRQIFQYASDHKYTILFIDAFHGAVPKHLGSHAILATLSKFLESPDVPVIISIHPDHWAAIVEDEPSLDRQFNQVIMPDYPAARIKELVKAWSRYIGEKQDVEYSNEAIGLMCREIEARMKAKTVTPENVVDLVEHAATLNKISAISDNQTEKVISERDASSALDEWR